MRDRRASGLAGNEAHLSAFATEAIGSDGARKPLYLHTSPEFACKKLLAAGEPRIVSFARVFRNRERGPLHHPEFTMLEWYRAGAAYTDLMRDCADLLALAAETAGAATLRYRGREADPFAAFERITLAQAFAERAGIDLLATIDAEGRTDRAALAAAVAAAGLRVAPTTRGRTSSAASSSPASSPISASGAPPSCANTR